MATTKKKTANNRKQRRAAATMSKKSTKNKYESFALTEDQQTALRDLDQQIAGKKIQLANQILQLDAFRAQKRKLVEEIESMNQEFLDVVKMMAKSHGINVEEERPDPWRLRLDTMEFTTAPSEAPVRPSN